MLDGISGGFAFTSASDPIFSSCASSPGPCTFTLTAIYPVILLKSLAVGLAIPTS